MKIGLQDATYLGRVAFNVLFDDAHRPIVNGKCNKNSIEDFILDKIYTQEFGPMCQEDVNFIVETINEVIKSETASL